MKISKCMFSFIENLVWNTRLKFYYDDISCGHEYANVAIESISWWTERTIVPQTLFTPDCDTLNSETLKASWGYWHQRAGERRGDPPRSFSGQRQGWKTPRWPSGSALFLCVCNSSALLGDLRGVSRYMEGDLLSVMLIYPSVYSSCVYSLPIFSC